MKMNEFFLAQLEREAPGTRRALERVPEGRNDWKPNEKSMPLGYLACLVAKLPAWVAMMIWQDDYDLQTADPRYHPMAMLSTPDLLGALDTGLADARKALTGTDDAHLMKTWRLKIGGQVVSEQLRHVAISDAALSHLAHHRGQLTVYLRLLGASVPAIYGPSADER